MQRIKGKISKHKNRCYHWVTVNKKDIKICFDSPQPFDISVRCGTAFSKLENEDQLAGVLGHEIGHVVGRHSAERLAKQGLTEGILNGVAVGIDPSTAQGAAAIANVINLSYGRDDELESDELGVKL